MTEKIINPSRGFPELEEYTDKKNQTNKLVDCCYRGNLGEVNFILRDNENSEKKSHNQTVDINGKDISGITPLICAITAKNYVENNTIHTVNENVKIEIVKSLLNDKNIDVNKSLIINGLEFAPIRFAIINGNSEIVKLLLQHPKMRISYELREFYLQLAEDNEEMKNSLNDYFARIALKDLINYCKKGNIEEITQLLNLGIIKDINEENEYGDNPLTAVINSRMIKEEDAKIKIISELLRYPNININKSSSQNTEYRPIYLAISNKHNKILNLLLQDPNINIDDKLNIFHIARTRGNKEAIKILNDYFDRLSLKYYPQFEENQQEIKERRERTELIESLFNCFPDEVEDIRRLLQSTRVRDINGENNFGFTPIFHIILNTKYDESSKIVIIKELLKRYPNLDVNQQSIINDTPISYLIKQGQNGILELLIKQPNAKISEENIEIVHNNRNEITQNILTDFLFQRQLMSNSLSPEEQVLNNNLLIKCEEILLNPYRKLLLNCYFGNIEGVRKLLTDEKTRISIKQNNQEIIPLICVVIAGSFRINNEYDQNTQIEIIEELLKYIKLNVNKSLIINDNDYTPVSYAIKQNQNEMLKLLLKQPNIQVNFDDLTNANNCHNLVAFNMLISFFIKKAKSNTQVTGERKILQDLLSKANMVPNISPNNKLLLSCYFNNEAIEIERLLRSEEINDINERNEHGNYPLSCAVYNIKHKSENSKNSKNNKKVIKMFLRHPDLDINEQLNELEQYNLFNWVISNRYNETLSLLLLKQPNLDINRALDKFGKNNVFNWIILENHNGTLGLLLDRFELDIDNNDINNYIKIAEKCRNKKAKDLLNKYYLKHIEQSLDETYDDFSSAIDNNEIQLSDI